MKYSSEKIKNSSLENFYGFWQFAFDISKEQLKSGKDVFSNSGFYFERDPERIYQLENLLDKTTVYCGKEENLKDLNSFELLYDDTDNYLFDLPELTFQLHQDYYLEEVHREDEQIKSFFETCTEDEVDTLDYDFTDESQRAWVVKFKEDIVAMGCFYTIPKTNGIIELTLLTSRGHRAKGIATALVQKMLEVGLSEGLCPRYRVKEDNYSSKAVAKKFGFIPSCRIKSYKRSN